MIKVVYEWREIFHKEFYMPEFLHDVECGMPYFKDEWYETEEEAIKGLEEYYAKGGSGDFTLIKIYCPEETIE